MKQVLFYSFLFNYATEDENEETESGKKQSFRLKKF